VPGNQFAYGVEFLETDSAQDFWGINFPAISLVVATRPLAYPVCISLPPLPFSNLLDEIKKLIEDRSLMSFSCCHRIAEIRRGLPSFVSEVIFAGIASYPEDNRRNKASTLKKPTLFRAGFSGEVAGEASVGIIRLEKKAVGTLGAK
jgi:hypothetical protein